MSEEWTTAYFPEETKRMDHFSASRIREMARRPAIVEELAESLFAAEQGAAAVDWEAQEWPANWTWADLPESNRNVVRQAVPVMLDRLADLLEQP